MGRFDHDDSRSLPQNAKFHAMCRDIARCVEWAGRKWSEEDWKRILLAAKFEQAVVPNPLGYSVIVVNKKRSRDLTADEMIEFIGEIEAFGVENGVDWTDDE
jgi:hypothetical protein